MCACILAATHQIASKPSQNCLAMHLLQANFLHHLKMTKQLFWAPCVAVPDVPFCRMDALLNANVTTMRNTCPIFFLLCNAGRQGCASHR